MKTRILITTLAFTQWVSAAISYSEWSTTAVTGGSYNDYAVAKFNSDLGTLTGVEVTVSISHLQGSFTVVNPDPVTSLTVGALDSTMTVRQAPSSGLGFTTTPAFIYDIATTPTWASVTILPLSFQVFSVDADQDYTFTPQSINPTYWSAYQSSGGLGTVTFQAKNVPVASITGGLATQDPTLTVANTQFQVTYTYTVPETSAALLGGLGLLTLLRRRRR